MNKIIILTCILFIHSCCKTNDEILSSEKIQIIDFGLLDTKCSKFYSSYFILPNSTDLILIDNIDTLKFYATTGVEYDLTYKKIGVDDCAFFSGNQKLDIVEIITAVRK